MAKYINEYPGRVEYDADAVQRKELQASTVSKVGGGLKYDGVNVEVKIPSMGDAVYHNAEKKVIFIKYGTLLKEALPDDYVGMGVCGPMRDATHIYIVAGQVPGSESKKMVEFCRWKVSGFTLDNSPHTCSVNLQNKPVADFTYQADTMEAFTIQLDAHLRAQSVEPKIYHAYMENGGVMVQQDGYTQWQEPDFMRISTLTVEAYTGGEIKLEGSPYKLIDRKQGGTALWSWHRWRDHRRTDAEDNNPKEVITASNIPTSPVRLNAYLGNSSLRDKDYCEYLRSLYGEGEEGWNNYLQQYLPIIPYGKGLMANRDGLGTTRRLAAIMVNDSKGTPTHLYPTATFANEFGYEGVKGLDRGDWFAPTPSEMVEVGRHWTYGSGDAQGEMAKVYPDKMNNTLYAMGRNRLSCTAYSWMLSRCSQYNCWYAHSDGGISSYLMCRGLRVVLLGLHELCSE